MLPFLEHVLASNDQVLTLKDQDVDKLCLISVVAFIAHIG